MTDEQEEALMIRLAGFEEGKQEERQRILKIIDECYDIPDSTGDPVSNTLGVIKQKIRGE